MWAHRVETGRGHVEIRISERSDGDFANRVDPKELASRRSSLVSAEWCWLKQVHGAVVHLVESPGQAAGRDGDGLLTTSPGIPVSVTTADCAPVVLVSESGGVAALHAGWPGLLAGVVEQGARDLRAIAPGKIVAVLGPCVRPLDYEFGAADLDRLVGRFGAQVAATTRWGTPAFDVATAVRTALSTEGVEELLDLGIDTTNEPNRCWSHRARVDTGRHATVAWLDQGASDQ